MLPPCSAGIAAPLSIRERADSAAAEQSRADHRAQRCICAHTASQCAEPSRSRRVGAGPIAVHPSASAISACSCIGLTAVPAALCHSPTAHRADGNSIRSSHTRCAARRATCTATQSGARPPPSPALARTRRRSSSCSSFSSSPRVRQIGRTPRSGVQTGLCCCCIRCDRRSWIQAEDCWSLRSTGREARRVSGGCAVRIGSDADHV